MTEDVQYVKTERVRPWTVRVKLTPRWSASGKLQEIGEVELTVETMTEDDAKKLAKSMATFAEEVLKDQYDRVLKWNLPV